MPHCAPAAYGRRAHPDAKVPQRPFAGAGHSRSPGNYQQGISNEAAFRYGQPVPAPRARQPVHARGRARDLRPVDRARRQGPVQGHAAVLRVAARLAAGLPAATRHGAARPRPSLLDRGCGRRHRIPRAPHRPAAPRRLAPALHPGRAHPLASARSQQAAVGGVRDRGPRQHSGLPSGSFAFYIKFHHAAIDGEGGTVVLQAIHSFSSDTDEEDGQRRSRVRDRNRRRSSFIRARS